MGYFNTFLILFCLILFWFFIFMSILLLWCRTVAEYHFRKCRMYWVQPYWGEGSGNCCKEVSVNGKSYKDMHKISLPTYLMSSYFELLYFFFVVLFCFKPQIFRLRDHVQGVDNNPLLIFPEGTCVNNHYTVMFKKVMFLSAFI